MKILRLIFLILIFNLSTYATQITIVGCGYVGLCTAAILSNAGHSLICVDINKEKINNLQNKILPIHEPYLYGLLFNSPHSENVFFTDDISQAMDSEVFYLCTETPTDANGHCNRSYLYTACKSIINLLTTHDNKILCVKSTVPFGTIKQIHEFIPEELKNNIQVVYNPEFMRQGSAIQDIYTNNPIVLSGSPSGIEKIETLYKSFITESTRIIRTNYETAEVIKYAWNTFSAIRITYINELSVLCRELGADIPTVVKSIALSESLLPTSIIRPGPGYGGSCLPKETISFSKIIEDYGYQSSMIHQAIQSNKNHQERIIKDILEILNATKHQKTVTVLGLAFKARTNDIRYSPAITIIEALLDNNIRVKAYDAHAINEMKRIYPSIEYFDSPYQAIENTDMIVVLTECENIEKLDLEKVASLCNQKIIIDTKNLYDTAKLKKHGFSYINMGLL